MAKGCKVQEFGWIGLIAKCDRKPGKAKPKALQLESESARLRHTHGMSDTDSDTDNDSAVRISELRFLSR